MSGSTGKLIDVEVAPDVSTPRAMRRLFAREFAGRPFLDDLLLCVSELVTNAVLHAGPPIRVVARSAGGTTRVEVGDGSRVAPKRRVVDARSPSGRGLHLIDELASSWGVDLRADGKIVWFEFAPAR